MYVMGENRMDLGYLYLATFVVLALEVVCGRYRGLLTSENVKSTLGSILGNAVTRPIAAIIIAAAIGFALPTHQGALATTPLYIAFPVVFVIAEFAFYWVHRWSHEGKGHRLDWLWKLHRTHHSGKFMNVVVTTRMNVFWPFVVPTPWVLGVATYLGMEQGAALTLMTIYGWNLITHANFRWDDVVRRQRFIGPVFRMMEHIVVSPGIHHTHHGYGRDGGNFRNYAVTLSILDWMFGTLHIPHGRPWKYGVPGPQPHWAEDVFFPIVRPAKGKAAVMPADKHMADLT
jgi:sterol desaturase/sphingolipid hydroxylase (fatty acid hydroxylase superfamily)